jgi:hypothetical protein
VSRRQRKGRSADRFVEYSWPAAWSVAFVAIGLDRAVGDADSAVAILIIVVGLALALRATLLLADVAGVLTAAATRDRTRLTNRVGAAVGLALRTTRPLAVLELGIAIGWAAYGIAQL